MGRYKYILRLMSIDGLTIELEERAFGDEYQRAGYDLDGRLIHRMYYRSELVVNTRKRTKTWIYREAVSKKTSQVNRIFGRRKVIRK